MSEIPKFEFQFVESKRLEKLFVCPGEGDMNYLFLSLYQAQCLLDELRKTIKLVNQANFDDTLVIPFPKKENKDE